MHSLRSQEDSGDLGMCVAQHTAQNRVNYEMKPVQGFLQLVLKTSKDGDCTATLGNVLHCLTVLMKMKFCLIRSQKHFVFILCLLSVILPLCKQPGSVLSVIYLQVLEDCSWVSLEHSLHHTEQDLMTGFIACVAWVCLSFT